MLHHAQQVVEDQHLLALVQVARRSQRRHGVRQVQRALQGVPDVVDELRQVCGLQDLHVLPGVAEDGSQAFLELVALRGKVNLGKEKIKERRCIAL